MFADRIAILFWSIFVRVFVLISHRLHDIYNEIVDILLCRCNNESWSIHQSSWKYCWHFFFFLTIESLYSRFLFSILPHFFLSLSDFGYFFRCISLFHHNIWHLVLSLALNHYAKRKKKTLDTIWDCVVCAVHISHAIIHSTAFIMFDICYTFCSVLFCSVCVWVLHESGRNSECLSHKFVHKNYTLIAVHWLMDSDFLPPFFGFKCNKNDNRLAAVLVI